MAYKVIILYQLYMPSYFLGTFTEYPYYIFVIPLFCVRPCQSEYLFCGMVGIPLVRRW